MSELTRLLIAHLCGGGDGSGSGWRTPEVISAAVSWHVAVIILFWAAQHWVATDLFIVVLVPDSPDAGAYKYIHLDLGIYDIQFVVRLPPTVCVCVRDCVGLCFDGVHLS